MKECYFDFKLKIFFFSFNWLLVEKIVVYVGVELGKFFVDCFSDGEI